MCAPEIPSNVFLGIPPLLVRNDDATVFPDGGKSTRHRLVVPKQPVAVQFDKVRKSQFQIVKRERARRMPSDLHFLPSGEHLINLPFCLFNLLFHRAHFSLEIGRIRLRMLFQFVQLLFEFDDWFLEFQGFYLHLTITGESFGTKANSSSMSAGPSSIPVPGCCALGVLGLVSEYSVIPLSFTTIHRLLPRYFFSPKATRIPSDQAIFSRTLNWPRTTFAGGLTSRGLYQRKKFPLFIKVKSPLLVFMT